MAQNIKSILDRLSHLVEHPSDLPSEALKLQEQIWKGGSLGDEDARWEILRDLAYDLEYYEADPKVRSENSSFFGEDRAIHEIKAALAKLMP